MLVITQKRIYRSDLQENPHVVYLFGDNLIQEGLGGQAGEMRGEPNAIGIPTKKAPNNRSESFFTDSEFKENCDAILAAFKKIPEGTKMLVIPSDGLGTGLSALPEVAPKTNTFLQGIIKHLREQSCEKSE